MTALDKTIDFGENFDDDDHASIVHDKKNFLLYQKQLETLNLKVKEIKKLLKQQTNNIFKYLEEKNISSIMVDDYVFSQAYKESFSCTKEQLEEKFPDIDTSELYKTKKSRSIKLRNA